MKKVCSHCNLINSDLDFQRDPFLTPEMAEAGLSESGLRNADLDLPIDSPIFTHRVS